MLLFVTEGNAILCPLMPANKTFNAPDDDKFTISSDRHMTIGFNVTGSNRTEILRTMGGATLELHFWNGTAWDFDINNTHTAGIGSSRNGGAQTYQFVYNFTGNEKWWLIFNDPDIGTHWNFSYWNGSRWLANRSLSIDTAITAGTAQWIAAASNFPSVGRYIVFLSAGQSEDFTGWEWNGSNFTSNNSLILGLNLSCCSKVILEQNFTGQNRLNAIRVGVAAANFVHFWNGTIWLNETGIPTFSNSFSGDSIVYNNFDNTGNATAYSGPFANNIWHFGRFEYQSSDNVVRSNLSASSFIGDNVVVNLTTYSRCNATEMSASMNNTGSFLPVFNQTISPAAAISSRFLNTTAFNRCARTIALRVNHTDTRNISSATNLTIVLLPAISSHNASSSQKLDLDCVSSSNLTITANTSMVVNVTLNMSGIFIGSNQTCPYGASRARSVRNENKSSGCSVFVFEANLTQSLNSTVGEATELSERGIGNIPAAIAASSIVTLLLVYTFIRKRRGE